MFLLVKSVCFGWILFNNKQPVTDAEGIHIIPRLKPNEFDNFMKDIYMTPSQFSHCLNQNQLMTIAKGIWIITATLSHFDTYVFN